MTADEGGQQLAPNIGSSRAPASARRLSNAVRRRSIEWRPYRHFEIPNRLTKLRAAESRAYRARS
jgi:hypothetical protein